MSAEVVVPEGVWKSCHLYATLPLLSLRDPATSIDVRLEWLDAISGRWRTIVGFGRMGGAVLENAVDVTQPPEAWIDSWVTRNLAGKRVRAVLTIFGAASLVSVEIEPSTAEAIRSSQVLGNSPSHYGTPTVGSNTGASSLTLGSHVVGTAADRLLHIGVGIRGAGTENVSSITFNTTENAVNRRSQVATNFRSEAWTLTAPTQTTADVVITLSATPTGMAAGASNYQDVDQTTPVPTNAGSNGSATSASTNITTANADSLLVDTIGIRAGEALTPGAGQTERWERQDALFAAASSDEGAPTVTTYTQTYSWTSSVAYAHIVLEVKAVVAAAPIIAEEEKQQSLTRGTPLFSDVDLSSYRPFGLEDAQQLRAIPIYATFHDTPEPSYLIALPLLPSLGTQDESELQVRMLNLPLRFHEIPEPSFLILVPPLPAAGASDDTEPQMKFISIVHPFEPPVESSFDVAAPAAAVKDQWLKGPSRFFGSQN